MDDFLEEKQCLFDNSGDVDQVDYAKPLARNNTAIVSRELLCPCGDSEEIRALQRDLMLATLQKDSALVALTTQQLSQIGSARNFLAVIGLLWNAKKSKRVQDRAYDEQFDKHMLETLLYMTNMPRDLLSSTRLMSLAIAVNDPLLLTTAIDLGADVNDKSLRIAPLHNALARNHTELVEILKQNGAYL